MAADLWQVNEEAAKLAAAPLWPLSDDDVIDMLRAAHRLQQVAATLQARLVAQISSRGLPAAQGHRSVPGWLRSLLLLDPQPAREITEHAAVLAEHPILERAVLDGEVDLRQAAVIAATVKAVPTDLSALTDGSAMSDGSDVSALSDRPDGSDVSALSDRSDGSDGSDVFDVAGWSDRSNFSDVPEVSLADAGEIARQAQTVMVDMAARLPAYQLRRVGERILTYVAPHLADRADKAALDREEARAHRQRGITLSLPVNGMVRLSGSLPTEDAATVHAALHPLCTPIPGEDRTAPQRRADALTDICRLALRTGDLPEDGGEPPQLAVTIAYDPLTRTLGTATTDTGTRLSPETARRLACDARILPIVLGGNSQILDAGRTRRLATGALRRALHVRDQGCAFPDCDRPPRWTDAHHITAWTNGGPTDLDNLVLLCRHHHRLIHHRTAGWQIRPGPDRKPDFIPPPTIDTQRNPRRNLYHQRQ